MYSLKSWWMVIHSFLILLFPLLSYCSNTSLNLHDSWYINLKNSTDRLVQKDGTTTKSIRPIVLDSGTGIIFGFFNQSSFFEDDNRSSNFYLVISLISTLNRYPPVVVWCANRDKPVTENATLRFTDEGSLQLEDSDGTIAWSTDTSGLSASQLKISSEGNLMLVDVKDNVIWQSFDYPTDTWLPNQTMDSSSKSWLTSNSSSTLGKGLYSLGPDPDHYTVVAYINSNPRNLYFVRYVHFVSYNESVIVLDNGSTITIERNNTLYRFQVNNTMNHFQYIKMESNGQVNLYTLPNFEPNTVPAVNVLSGIQDCAYPAVCGSYGICSFHGTCGCPGEYSGYFVPSQEWNPSQGCRPVTPLSCKARNLHYLLELKSISYFSLDPYDFQLDRESCKQACLDNCTCRAAFFSSNQGCSLKYELYSLQYVPESTDILAYIKVQNKSLPLSTSSTRPSGKDKVYLISILASTIPVGLVFILFVAYYYSKFRQNPNNNNEEEGDDDQVIGALKRFSFLELKSATRDFQVKLGKGGFGSVFEGDLIDGTKVAVKCLDSIGQGRKEFLAEVNTIGSINHFNLVKLFGYCAEKCNRLLVYEYMCNGSLEKWIFNQDLKEAFGWEIKKKIIIGLAKGLEYLHILCNPSIIHFNIKPQNILLDRNFNVKISDFGLAKLIDRDQSQVITALKGTPRYLAPELFSHTNITTKADIFSFGVVVLEIVLGRKNLDKNESCPLVECVKEKVKNDKLHELIRGCNEDNQFQKEEAMKLIKMGIRP